MFTESQRSHEEAPQTRNAHHQDNELGEVGMPKTSKSLREVRQRMSEISAEDISWESVNMLYKDDAIGVTGNCHIVSNEVSWNNQAVDTCPGEVLCAFGSNNMWDLAYRRDIKELVLADRDYQSIVAQEFLYKPLLLISENPAEFFAFLAGLPLTPDVEKSDLCDTCDAISSLLMEIEQDPTIDRSAEHQDFLRDVEQRLLNSTELTVDQAAFVLTYLENESPFARLSLEADLDTTLFELSVYSNMGSSIYRSFAQRYASNDPLGAGLFLSEQQIAEVMPGYGRVEHSVFSSMEGFHWLQNLFREGRVHYIVSDAGNVDAYKALNIFAKQKNYKISGLALGNITDYCTSTEERKASLMYRIGSAAMSSVDVDASFTIYNTRGTQQPLEYEQLEVHGDLIGAMREANYSVTDLETRSDLELGLLALRGEGPFCSEESTNQCTVEVDGATIRISAGELSLNLYTHTGEGYPPFNTRLVGNITVPGMIGSNYAIFHKAEERNILITAALLRAKELNEDVEEYLRKHRIILGDALQLYEEYLRKNQ